MYGGQDATQTSLRAARLLASSHPAAAQLVPGMIRGGAKPQTGRASRGKAAAKAVRTATKLSHKVTERYGAGY